MYLIIVIPPLAVVAVIVVVVMIVTTGAIMYVTRVTAAVTVAVTIFLVSLINKGHFIIISTRLLRTTIRGTDSFLPFFLPSTQKAATSLSLLQTNNHL